MSMKSGTQLPRRGLLAIFLLMLVAPSPAHAQNPEISSFIDEILAAYGTPERLAEVKAYRMTGTIQTISGSRGTSIRTFSLPERLKVELDYGERREARILVGPDGWRSTGAGGYSPVSGPLHGSMVLQALRASVPWILDGARETAEEVEPQDYQGKTLRSLQLSVSEGLVFRIYVDPETYLVLATQGLLNMGGISTAFETHYSDFREVDGVLFPFKEEGYASGQNTSSTTLEEIELNPALTDREFDPTGPTRWGDG
jgi:hypothetical protein